MVVWTCLSRWRRYENRLNGGNMAHRTCLGVLLLSGIVVLGTMETSWARDRDGEYKVRGLGADSCITFLSVPVSERGLYYSWLAGYLTAYNYLVPETYSVAEYSGLTRTNEWFENYCNQHPSHLLHVAARRFIAERHRVRLKAKPSSQRNIEQLLAPTP